MFENGVWQNSKEEVKDMSRRESSRHMFRLGFFMYSQYMNKQIKNINEKLKNMSKEDVEKMINNFKENNEEGKDERDL